MSLAAHPWLATPEAADRPLVLGLRFRSARFDQQGPLDPAWNAGQPFYGRDLALALAKALPAWSLGLVEEDWGWLLVGGQAERRELLAVYADPEEALGGGAWWLHLQAEAKGRWLGLFPVWRPAPYGLGLAAAVVAQLESWGIEALRLEAAS